MFFGKMKLVISSIVWNSFYFYFFIDLGVGGDLIHLDWKMLVVYASTDDKWRRLQWNELSKRNSSSQWKCIVIGDFNDTMDDEEKERGNYCSMASKKGLSGFPGRK